MGSRWSRGIADNVREELWSYFALTGLLFLNIGIVLVVYALKKALPYPIVLEVFGLGLIIMGVLTTLASWYVHRQHRRKKPICMFFCCDDSKDFTSETADTDSVSKSRQNNLYSTAVTPYKGVKLWEAPQAPVKARTMYSTPEFQKYAEYMKRDTTGVEINGTHKFKVESLRQKKHVHPKPLSDAPAAAKLVKAIYTQKGQVNSQLLTVSNPTLVKLSH